jgi:chromosome segregation ATPase
MTTSDTGSCSHKDDRVEIDMRAPFESVKAAVSMFGERAIGDKITKKRPEIPEEKSQISKETQLHLLQKDLVKLRERLNNTETTKAQAQVELTEAKKVVKDLSRKFEKATESREKACTASEIARLRAEEVCAANTDNPKGDNTGWQLDLTAARNELIATTAELEDAKKELRRMKQEFQTCMEIKAFAVKQAEEAIVKVEVNSSRAKELQKEIVAAHESHALLKLACMEAEKERVSITAEREAIAREASAAAEQIRKQKLAIIQDLGATKDLERELAVTTAAVENLQNKVNLVKSSESKVCKGASHPIENLNKVKEEIEKANKQESDACSSLESKTLELEQAKLDLKKVSEEGFCLSASMDCLKAELDKKKKELIEINEVEAKAETRAADLNAELHKARSKLAVAIAAEEKAKNAATHLSQALQQINIETEQARKEAESMNEEACKAKLETEQAKAEMDTIESRLQSAYKELEEAKAAEAIAMEQIKSLSEKTSAARASTSESSGGITISHTEFDSLSRRVGEINRLTDKKVAAVMAQIDAVKASEQEILMKLEVSYREIEELKSAEERELCKADMAEAAKRAVDGELIRWREREQQKKHAPFRKTSELLISGKNNASVSFAERKSLNFQAFSEPLIMNSHLEKQGGVGSAPLSLNKKKKQIIPSIGRFFRKRKRAKSSLS